jgi:PAT family beta-lactamase induction signal transducer AmpG
MFRRRRVIVQVPLGFGSGLPYLLTGSTLGAWLASAGLPVATVGMFALVALPYSLKPLWAPLIDRHALPLLGRRRGWMFVLQLALAAALAAMGAIGPAPSPRALALAALLVATLSATHDIACDAYRSDVLADDERAPGGALFVLGYRAAMVLSGGAALVLADHLSWRAVYALLALGLVPALVATLRAPEPAAGAVRAPATLREAVVAPLGELFGRRGAVALLGFIALYRAGDLVANVLVAPFLLGAGFSKSEVGVVYKMVGTAATIAGALGGGTLVARLGLRRALALFAVAQTAGPLAYAALALGGGGHPLLWLAVGADSLGSGLGIAALEALLLSSCDRRFSATQYALLAAASGVVGRLAGAGSGFVVAAVGWAGFFAATALLALPTLVLWRRLPLPSPPRPAIYGGA